MFDESRDIFLTPPIGKRGFRSVQIRMKRLIDFTGALLMIVFLSFLMGLIGLLIAVMNGRPIIYGHERIGRDGKPFKCLKFRTMVRDADAQLKDLLHRDPRACAEWNERQKLRDDPRIIPGIGTLLRSSSLDELPQLFNVLRGEMSLVGPRPIVQDELDRCGGHQDLYMAMRPGMTGPWQIGERSDGDYESRVRTDINYVCNWSCCQDLMILLRTAQIVLCGRSPGAY